MKQKIFKLIDVKSIVTIMTALVFCIMALIGRVSSEQFLTVFTVIISFYFGTQSAKVKENSDIKEDEASGG